MDMFDKLFDSGRATLTCIFNATINNPLALKAINKKIERYAEIYSITKTDHGYHVELALIGNEQSVNLEVREIRLSEDKKHISLHGLKASIVWIHHLLEDHIEGKEFETPDNELLRKILSFL